MKSQVFAQLIAAFLFPFLVTSPSWSAEVAIIEDGKSDYVIALPDKPAPSERTAARELQQHLLEAASVKLPIQSESEVPVGSPRFILGRSSQLEKLAPEFATLKPDGIILRTIDRDILLTGEGPRGTLYAVYTFLEEVVGCRWWAPGEQSIPRSKTITVSKLEKVYAPPFWSRATVNRRVCNGRFAARLKLNGHEYRTPPEYGGFHIHDGFVHTMGRLIPPSKYFREHPDWFALRNGQRVGNAQPCLTSEAMRKELIRNALARLRRHTDDVPVISISQNDNNLACQCEACQAIVKREGSESGPLLHFINVVAEEIEKEFPNVLIETLAYRYTRTPPKIVRPRKNVLIRLCSIECNFGRPLSDSETNGRFLSDLKAWSRISQHMWIWDYGANFKNYLLPHPNLKVLAPNLRLFAKHGVSGVYHQGGNLCAVADFLRLKHWLIARLLWDPSQDEGKLIDEFLAGYYGLAAPHLRKYLDLICDAGAKSGERIHLYSKDTSRWLKPSDLFLATELFRKAEASVAGDRVLAGRVRRERLTLDQVWLMRWHDMRRHARINGIDFAGPPDQGKATEEFITTCNEFRAERAGMLLRFQDYEPILRSWVRKKAPVPELCRDLAPEDWLDIQDYSFNLGNRNQSVIVDDELASDGKAVRMPGTHSAWAAQFWVQNEIAARGPWRCYVSVRFQAKSKKGRAMSLGLYKSRSTGSVKRFLNSDHPAGRNYELIDLGVQDLKRGMYFWAAPPARPLADVPAVFVDRIILVRSSAQPK